MYSHIYYIYIICLYVLTYMRILAHFLNACLNAGKSSCLAAGGTQHIAVSATSTFTLLLARLIRARVAYAVPPKLNRSVLNPDCRVCLRLPGHMCLLVYIYAFLHSILCGNM